MDEPNNLPIPDGISDDFEPLRVIRGKRAKQIDGHTTVDGTPYAVETQLLVPNMVVVAQRFRPEGGAPDFFFIDKNNPASKVDELNNAIPQEDWPIGLNGDEREPPWKLFYVVYLVDMSTGETITMSNSTAGMRIAYRNLREQIITKRAIEHAPVLPIVTISSAPMKIKGKGFKQRPAFEVVGWKGLNGEHAALKSLPAPTTEEIVNDTLPLWDDPLTL